MKNWLSDMAAFIRYYPLAFLMVMAEREAAALESKLARVMGCVPEEHNSPGWNACRALTLANLKEAMK